MEVDVLPLAVAAVPHAGLLRLHGAGHAAGVHVLGQSDVGDARGVLPDEVHMWVQQDGVHGLIPLGQGCKRDPDYTEVKQNTAACLCKNKTRIGLKKIDLLI